MFNNTKEVIWNNEKNKWLKEVRGISFEEVIACIDHGGLIHRILNPNQDKYPGQEEFIISCKEYVYIIPFEETRQYYFLKTIIPSRKAKKKYSIN